MSQFIIKDLNKQFEEKSILKNINIDLDMGKFLALLGPSGCGKSTLLKIIAGIETCNSGTIMLNNKILNNVKPKDRDISMVFQSYALYPNLNVHGNIDFGLKVRKVDKKNREKIIHDLVRMLKIEKHLHKKPAKLSGGERQRVAIARALARKPKLFLFDEPLSNLDAELRQQMRIEIKRLHQKLGITTIYVTHDQIEAMTLGDIIVVMKGGEIQQIGSPKEIYQQPANLFVAGFIGSPPMNFIPVDIVTSKQGTYLKISDRKKSWLLPIKKDVPVLKKGTQVFLGIRPNHISIKNSSMTSSKKAPGKEHEILSDIKLIEYTGEETFFTTEINNTEILIKTAFKNSYSPGDKIKLLFDMSNAFLFEKRSGRRIA